MGSSSFYGDAIASIHNVAFASLVEGAAPRIIRLLRQRGIHGGRVLDLGCGGGQLSETLARAGYQPCGIDVSPAMIEQARLRVPSGRFFVGSVDRCDLPSCAAAVALGEVLSYLDGPVELRRALGNVFRALDRGGLFVFDLCTVRAGDAPLTRREVARSGKDWALLATVEQRRRPPVIRRAIVAFVRRGRYVPSEVAGWLRRRGFRVLLRRGYGDFQLDDEHRVFIARRPA